MKTKETALSDMRRLVLPGTSGFLYRYVRTGSWSWATAGSPIGELCSASTDGSAAIRDSQGRVIAPIFDIEPCTIPSK